MLLNFYHFKKVANYKYIPLVGGIGVAPIESEDDGFTARSAAAYGITSHWKWWVFSACAHLATWQGWKDLNSQRRSQIPVCCQLHYNPLFTSGASGENQTHNIEALQAPPGSSGLTHGTLGKTQTLT